MSNQSLYEAMNAQLPRADESAGYLPREQARTEAEDRAVYEPMGLAWSALLLFVAACAAVVCLWAIVVNWPVISVVMR